MSVRVPPLGAAEVHVWTVPVAAIGHPDEALAALAEDERARALRFRFAEDRARYVAGRFAARALIAAYAGHADPAALKLVPGTHGKPTLDPARPLHFNWSHAGHLAVFAITADAEVGVDVEWTERFADIDAVAGRVFSDRELADYHAQQGDARRVAFFNGWTRKEAFIKATGEGLSRALKGFDVALAPGEPAAVRHIEDRADDVARWSLHAFEPVPGYIAAVAVRAPSIRPRLMAWPGG
jgi:4'-phosphopantetheinyl transferase